MLTEAMAAVVLYGSHVVIIGARRFMRFLTLTLVITVLHCVNVAMTRVITDNETAVSALAGQSTGIYRYFWRVPGPGAAPSRQVST